jgi:hypothetical protein
MDAPSNNLQAIRPADIDPRFNCGRHLPALGTMAVDFEERDALRRPKKRLLVKSMLFDQ